MKKKHTFEVLDIGGGINRRNRKGKEIVIGRQTNNA